MLMEKLKSRVSVEGGVVAATAANAGLTVLGFDIQAVKAVGDEVEAVARNFPLKADPYDVLDTFRIEQARICELIAGYARVTLVCEGETLADREDAEVLTDWVIPITLFGGINVRVGDPAIHGWSNPSATFRPIGDHCRYIDGDVRVMEKVPVGLFSPAVQYLAWTGDEAKAELLGRKASDGYWKWSARDRWLEFEPTVLKTFAERFADRAARGRRPTYQQQLGRGQFDHGRGRAKKRY